MAADAGDDAEGAAIVASVLDFEVEAGAGVFCGIAVGFEDGSGEEFGVGEDVGDEKAGFRRTASGIRLWVFGLGYESCEGDEGGSLSG